MAITADQTTVYLIDGKAYVNLTNRCSNDCTFCLRRKHSGGVYGDGRFNDVQTLWLKREPTAAEVIQSFKRVQQNITDNEVVFCGYGEPTEAFNVLTEVAEYLKGGGYSLRLDTNGQGSLINGKDITPVVASLFSTVSISLNAPTQDEYQQICSSRYDNAFQSVIEFARGCKDLGCNVIFTVVDCIGEKSIVMCQTLCDSMNIPLRVRALIN